MTQIDPIAAAAAAAMAKSAEAEQSVLGAAIQSAEAYDEISQSLTADDFVTQGHGLIYQALADLYESGSGVDIVTVNAALANIDPDNRSGFQDSDESLAYIAALVDAVPNARHAASYASILVDHSARRRLLSAGTEIQAIANMPLDGREMISRATSLLENINVAGEEKTALTARQVAYNAIDEIESRWGQNSLIGLTTGFIDLDEMTSGLQKADLFILAGRPSQGKSTVALNIAEHVAKKHRVLFFSLEMSATALGHRMISSLGGIDFGRLRSLDLAETDLTLMTAAVEQMKNLNLVIDDEGGLSVDRLRSKARILARRHGCDLIVVDYLQMLTGVGENKTTETGYISRQLKRLAKDLNVPVLALSQLNRSLANRSDKRPEMSDLRGSGDIEQDADVIAFIHLEQKYDPDTYLRGIGELIIAKQRQGETGTVYLEEQLNRMRYRTLDRPIPTPPQAENKKAKVSAFGL